MEDEAISANVWRLMSNERKMHHIIVRTAMAYGFTVEDLTGKCRTADVSHARHAAMWICNCQDIMIATRTEVGKYFGGRSHSMVLHGCKKVEEILAEGGPEAEMVLTIKKTLREAPKHPGWVSCISEADKPLVAIAQLDESYDYQNVERLLLQSQLADKSKEQVIDRLLKIVNKITQ